MHSVHHLRYYFYESYQVLSSHILSNLAYSRITILMMLILMPNRPSSSLEFDGFLRVQAYRTRSKALSNSNQFINNHNHYGVTQRTTYKATSLASSEGARVNFAPRRLIINGEWQWRCKARNTAPFKGKTHWNVFVVCSLQSAVLTYGTTEQEWHSLHVYVVMYYDW